MNAPVIEQYDMDLAWIRMQIKTTDSLKEELKLKFEAFKIMKDNNSDWRFTREMKEHITDLINNWEEVTSQIRWQHDLRLILTELENKFNTEWVNEKDKRGLISDFLEQYETYYNKLLSQTKRNTQEVIWLYNRFINFIESNWITKQAEDFLEERNKWKTEIENAINWLKIKHDITEEMIEEYHKTEKKSDYKTLFV